MSDTQNTNEDEIKQEAPDINEFEEIQQETPDISEFEEEEGTPVADALEASAGGILKGAGESIQGLIETGQTALISGILAAKGEITTDEALKGISDDAWNNRRNARITANKMRGKAPGFAATADFASTVAMHYASGKVLSPKIGRSATAFIQGAASGFTRTDSDDIKGSFVDAFGGGAMNLILPGALKVATKGGGALVQGANKVIPFDKAWESMKSSTKLIALGFTNATRRKNMREFLEITGQDEDKFLNWAINLKKGKKFIMNAGASFQEMRKEIGSKAASSMLSLQKSAGKHGIEINTKSFYDRVNKLLKQVRDEDRDGLTLEAKHYSDELLKMTHVMDNNAGLNAVVPTVLKPNIPMSDAVAFLRTIAKDGFKGSTSEVRGAIRNIIADIPSVLKDGGKIDPKVISEITRKANNYGNFVTLNRMAHTRFMDGSEGIASKIKHLIGVRGALVAAGLQKSVGTGPAAIVGMAANSALASKNLDTVMATQLRSISKGVSKYPDHNMWMSLATAAQSTTDYWRTALSGTTAKLHLKENRAARTLESFEIHSRKIASIIEQDIGVEEADAFSTVMDSGNSEDKERAIGELLSKSPKAFDEFIEEGIGFNGKVYTDEEKAFLTNNINKMDAPLQWKLQAKKDLRENGLVPKSPQEYVQAQDMLNLQQKKNSFLQGKLGDRY